MTAVVFGGISAGVALLGFLVTLLVMFGKIVDQNATLRERVNHCIKAVDDFRAEIREDIHALRNSQRR